MARNDPDWNSNNGGPPDLDELWRRFVQKVNGLFGRKTRGAGPREGRGKALALVAGILVVLWLATGLYVIPDGSRGLVLRLGTPQQEALPGPHWRLPFPIDRVQVVDLQQVRVARIGFLDNTRGSASADALMLTADQNLLNVQAAVQYTVKDPAAWAYNQRRPAETVRAAADSVIREAVANSPMASLLSSKRTAIAGQAARQLQTVLDQERLGVTVERVAFVSVQPPQPVQAASKAIDKAAQEAAQQKSEAQAYASDIMPKAQGDAARMLSDANAYKAQVVAKAQAEAARFNQAYAGYKQAPQLVREQMYLSTMKQVMTQANTIIVDPKSGGAVNLDLNKLLAQAPAAAPAAPEAKAPAEVRAPAEAKAPAEATPQAGAGAPPAAKAPVAAPQAASPSTDLRERSREALRSREREERP